MAEGSALMTLVQNAVWMLSSSALLRGSNGFQLSWVEEGAPRNADVQVLVWVHIRRRIQEVRSADGQQPLTLNLAQEWF